MAYLHVAIGFEGKQLDVADVQKVFGSAGWARYAPNCWIVSTNETPHTITERLRAICNQYDSIFVCELNMENRSGYLQKEIWDWLD